jgi:SAM-dependent methyltransferase
VASLTTGLRHLVPRQLRERYFPLYMLMTGRGEAVLQSQRRDGIELLEGALQRTDLFGQLFDQRILNLEARLARLEARLSEHELRYLPKEPIPLDDDEYLEFEVSNRGESWAIEERYRSVVASLRPGSDVLELGCGAGAFLGICQEMGHRAIGVDSSESMVAAALDAGHEVTLDDAVRFVERQPSATFDYVAAFHLVEHLPGAALRAMFREVHRILRPGGQFVVETPNVGSIKTMTDYYYVDPTHLMPRRVEQYAFVLRAIGFTEVRIDIITEPTNGRRRHPSDLAASSDHSCVALRAGEQERPIDPSQIRLLERRIAHLEGRLDIASDVRLFATRGAMNSDPVSYFGSR